MVQQPIKVAVIIGSTRNGRFAPTVAEWFVGRASARDDVQVDLIDLLDANLPYTLTDFGETPTDAVTAVTMRLAEAQAFVIVTPEYNHSYPVAIKNLVDWNYDVWQAKPVAFVSYGGLAGGLRAVEHLRQVFAELHAVTMRDTVSFHGASEQFGADGEPRDPEPYAQAASVLLDQLVWWAQALLEAKEKRPYKA
ncbi:MULTISPECIES: NADPH-dependent FMN reductase [Saccharothrix]|uniref:NADPH-dependent FMN reductase n=1 Tax=Saccharothrix TaxID=2071 RepID=UPI00093E55C0|nr:NAD(P)H-dependent oxidoreductase [Saccharothrix sp. CB00851]OKI29925.1 NADPH-dependent FMN reductase [Saccharothrix sp. CB00851]